MDSPSVEVLRTGSESRPCFGLQCAVSCWLRSPGLVSWYRPHGTVAASRSVLETGANSGSPAVSQSVAFTEWLRGSFQYCSGTGVIPFGSSWSSDWVRRAAPCCVSGSLGFISRWFFKAVGERGLFSFLLDGKTPAEWTPVSHTKGSIYPLGCICSSDFWDPISELMGNK